MRRGYVEVGLGVLIWKCICVVVCVICLPIIIFNVSIFAQSKMNKEKLPNVFGFCPLVVMSGSMEPTFNTDDLIFVRKVNKDTLKEDDIICYRLGDDFVTHRIVIVDKDKNGETIFWTAGDYTKSIDEKPVTKAQIQGTYKGRIKKLGGVVLFLQSPWGVMLMVGLPVVAILGMMSASRAEQRGREYARKEYEYQMREEEEDDGMDE